MCANCSNPMPEELVQHFGMGIATVADEMERHNDMRIRLSCLDIAVKVKRNDNDSRKVLSSAHAYYDFVVGNDKRESASMPHIDIKED